MLRMRVLLWLDAGAGDLEGHPVQGHIIQAERTAAALRLLGIDAFVSSDEREDPRGFDVVHGFGAQRSLLRRARALGVPVAVSTIYSSTVHTLGTAPRARGLRQVGLTASHRVHVAASVLRRGPAVASERVMHPLSERALMFECADLLLPNSAGEAAAVRRELGVTTPARVVPNGVDPAVFRLPQRPTTREYVLFVGRFEPHKNQLNLIRALKGSPFPLVLVGPPHPHHRGYYEACRRETAGRPVTFERATSHDDLSALYQGARVHVLPSWFETTGLVSLEAALSGCHVATTDRGFASEYLLDLAEYLDPSSHRSMLGAVTRAWERRSSEPLRKRVLDNYTWTHVAVSTKEAYSELLDGAPRGV